MDEYRSQCNLIAEHLEAGNTITAMEATGRPFYCYRLSARIHDLRHKRGMNIRTRQRMTKHANGVTKHFVEYYLEKE